jgi:ABC-type sulfate transport system permease component
VIHFILTDPIARTVISDVLAGLILAVIGLLWAWWYKRRLLPTLRLMEQIIKQNATEVDTDERR